MQMGLAFAGLVVVGAMAMAMYELFSFIEKHTTGLGAPRLAEPLDGLPRRANDPTNRSSRHLRRANEVARAGRWRWAATPSAPCWSAPDGETVLAEQGNVDTVNHAESTLARTAATNFTPDYARQCTLVTTVEPCAMCAGTQYWAHIGRLVYGMTERACWTSPATTARTRRWTCPAAACSRGAEDHRSHRPGARGGARNRRAAPGFLEIAQSTAP
jgi:tRNA(Arg) A34 adenosine deaminase TadA